MAGEYVYRTTFDLTGFDPATVSVSGMWAADDAGGIRLNGGRPARHSGRASLAA